MDVSGARDPLSRLLRWYPGAWRERYGDELVVLMRDDLNGRGPSWGYRRRVAVSGLRERATQSGLAGRSVEPAQRRRVGSLVILVSWFVMVLAGASYEKVSEHSIAALPNASRAGAQTAYDVVVALGVVGIVLVLAGAFAALPSLRRFLAAGGWASLRRHVWRGVALGLLSVAGVVAIASWAHGLTPYERNGGNGVYSAAFVVIALLAAATLGQWTAVAVAAGRRLALTDRILRVETGLALALGGVILAISVSASAWWILMARRAPSFLTGSPGDTASIVTPSFVVTLGLMAIAVATATVGVTRVMGARTPSPRSA